jgi:hypothetical protein
VVQAPTRDPGDFCIAHSADPALFMPEKAKRTSTPKRFLHMGCFALFEVDFIGGVVGVRVTFDFNVSLDGDATGMGSKTKQNGATREAGLLVFCCTWLYGLVWREAPP